MSASQSPQRPPPLGCYPRAGSGLEFARVLFFTDAVFAIALTLLVVALNPPQLDDGGADPGALGAALMEDRANIVGFFVGFVLLGRFWLSHHHFMAGLRSVDRRLIAINLVYLAFVAFTPFPVALISEYETNRLAFFLFAGCMTVVSLLELAMFVTAVRGGHTQAPASKRLVRDGLISSGVPILIMLASMPLAAIDTTLALMLWLVLVPFAAWANRRGPGARAKPAGRTDGEEDEGV